jgi:hypothetical protein
MKQEIDHLLELLEPAEPPADLADRAYRAAIAGEPIIEAPSFWQRLVPVAAPAAAAVAIAALYLWLGLNPVSPGAPAMPVEDAGVAAVLGEGELEGELVGALLVSEDPR